MSGKTKSYPKTYDDFTQGIIKVAEAIRLPADLKVKYTLPQIAYALRFMYKIPEIHGYFVKSEMNENKWSGGFCALASMEIYNRTGKDRVWNIMYLDQAVWSPGPVTYLRTKKEKINFGTTGEHFLPLIIPYELGSKIYPAGKETQNTLIFRDILEATLEKMA